jgi:vacuolar-type H+-ATPase subunit C/Vma6
MEKTGATAYVYAKACGMFSRSFVGPRAGKLFEVKRLQDLWTLLYHTEVPLVPEGMLALLLERKAEESALKDFITLLSMYDTPDPVSRALLSLYDYNNLKAVSSAVSVDKTQKPFLIDTGSFSLFDMSKWPDIAGITKNSPVPWFNRAPDVSEQVEWETKLDHEYYRSLWSAVLSLDSKDRSSEETQIREEIVLQNILWALRLKLYYNMKSEEIIPLLACNKADATLCRPAISILDRSGDSWKDWENWKYRWLLNTHEEGVPWTLDPRWAQLAADTWLYRLALRSFHQNSDTTGFLVAFFKIKQLEEHMIRVAAEGLRLGAPENQMKDFMGDAQHV